jgi:small subunit ribosomal protein S13
MARIAGVDIPGEKGIEIALTYIYGIGRKLSRDALKAIGIDGGIRTKNVSEDEVSALGAYIEKNFAVEGQLRRQESQNLSRMKSIGCYRGLRHRMGLPVRGQRTKTNARTRKGKRRTVSVKKSVKEMKG